MKHLFFILLPLFLIFASVSFASEDAATLLVYMCGSELEEDAYLDLVEMAEAEADSVNIVVLAGGSSDWEIEELEGNTRNLAVIRDGGFESVEDWGPLSMGSEDCLYQFLEYGITRWPAKRMIVVLWNHGAGSEAGLCFDATADDDGLTLPEIDRALSRLKKATGGFHIDLFGVDACMMAGYELAALLSQYDIDCMVASEELEPSGGWHYTSWLEALSENPSMSNGALCEKILDGFMDASLSEEPDDILTLSAISLPRVRPLKESMERFAASMIKSIQADGMAAVRRGRSRMYTFGSYDDGSWDMVDLGAALDAYAKIDPVNAAEARRLLSSAVIANRQTKNLSATSGLSILIPQDTAEDFIECRDDFNLSSCIPNWVEFVNGYVSLLTGGHYTFSGVAAEPVAPDTILSAVPAAFVPDRILGWNGDAYTPEEPSGPVEIRVGDGEYAFSASLSGEDMQALDYVEGMLMMDVSDEDMEGYVDFGLMRNNLIDWKEGKVYSLFDGSWPVFGEQPVPLYDQTVNEYARRSLLPVKLNGKYTYLVVLFSGGETEGRVLGANAGYDESGLPIRAMTPLSEGDEIIPVYTLFYGEPDSDEEFEEMEFDGDPIRWREGMTVTYEDLSEESDDDEPLEALFCFVLNDIYGGYTMTDPISFEF